MTKVIILSAGRGKRLLPLTANTPKCLLEIGDGVTVMEAQLTELSKSRHIEHVVVVLGYLAGQVEAKIESFKSQLHIDVVYNPFFDIADNLISLWCARSTMDSDFMIINGDNIFNQNLLNSIMTDQREGFLVAVNTKDKYDEDDMKVIISDNNIMQIGKGLPLENADGEAGGFHKVSGRKYVDVFRKAINKAVRSPEARSQYYLKVFSELIEDGVSVQHVGVNRNDWAEIDFHPDLHAIRANYIESGHRLFSEEP